MAGISKKQKKNRNPCSPVVLCILDGWGDKDGGEDNAIFQAKTPTWDKMKSTYPYSQLEASSSHVGLPTGQMGNSEVGHMNLGAGRIVKQDLPLINQAIDDGTIKDSTALIQLITNLKSTNGVCHLLGLTSPGGVHSHQNHLIELAKIIDNAGVQCKLHAFMDGRDTPPNGGKKFIEDITHSTKNLKKFSIATLMGRYWAMDRDKNWDRVEKAYDAIVDGIGIKTVDSKTAIKSSYSANILDEFIEPHILGDYRGMKDGDAILIFNFRSDRARQIMTCFVDANFTGFKRKRFITFSSKISMTEYSQDLKNHVNSIFPKRKLKKILGEVVSDAGLTQLRTAETEKYAHITFFFNGGEEKIFPSEERILVPSPKIRTYDLKPEMSAIEVTNNLVNAIEACKFDLIIVNYANGDMVGHTGIFKAAVKAAETIDVCLDRLEKAILKVGGAMLITADHGNAEQMFDPVTQQPHTAHTLTAVPLVLVNPPVYTLSINNGILADVAPTILRLLELNKPDEMTGVSLISEQNKI